MIPFKPEPIGALQERFKRATSKVYSVEKALLQPETDRPGAMPENIYDFEDGIRLIISREQYKGTEVIHFSGSFSDDNIFRDKGKRGQAPIMAMMRACFDRLRQKKLYPEELNGVLELEEPETDHKFIGFSPGGIPHWCVPLANIN